MPEAVKNKAERQTFYSDAREEEVRVHSNLIEIGISFSPVTFDR